MEIANWENNGNELVREFLFDNQSELAKVEQGVPQGSLPWAQMLFVISCKRSS